MAHLGAGRGVALAALTGDRDAVQQPPVGVERIQAGGWADPRPKRPLGALAGLGAARLPGARDARRRLQSGRGARPDPRDRWGRSLVDEPQVAVRSRRDPEREAAGVQTA